MSGPQGVAALHKQERPDNSQTVPGMMHVCERAIDMV